MLPTYCMLIVIHCENGELVVKNQQLTLDRRLPSSYSALEQNKNNAPSGRYLSSSKYCVHIEHERYVNPQFLDLVFTFFRIETKTAISVIAPEPCLALPDKYLRSVCLHIVFAILRPLKRHPVLSRS